MTSRHLIEGFLGGDAAIHDPGAPLFAVAVGDFPEHVGERGFIRGVAAHDFVTDGKAIGGDDESDDDLHTVGTLVAAVTEGFETARLGDRAVGIDLEVGAGEIVEQVGHGAALEPGTVEFPLAAWF